MNSYFFGPFKEESKDTKKTPRIKIISWNQNENAMVKHQIDKKTKQKDKKYTKHKTQDLIHTNEQPEPNSKGDRWCSSSWTFERGLT